MHVFIVDYALKCLLQVLLKIFTKIWKKQAKYVYDKQTNTMGV